LKMMKTRLNGKTRKNNKNEKKTRNFMESMKLVIIF
jgi:hypothetical protein